MDNLQATPGWRLLTPKMPIYRAQKLAQYATQFLEPALQSFPELKEPIYLTLRNHGFIGRTEPYYCIVVNESILDNGPEWKIRFCTAYLLMYFVQSKAGIALLPHATSAFLNRQATFFTLIRGFAYDFLKVFQADCSRASCDFSDSFSKIRCGKLFYQPCKLYTDAQLKAMALFLQEQGAKYSLLDCTDYEAALSRILSEANKELLLQEQTH